MGPRDWIETIKEVVKKIGNTGDTGGSQTEGTVFGKENAILESVQNALQRGTVRNIQRGLLQPSTAQSLTVALSGFTNLEKMIAFINGAGYSGQALQEFMYYIESLSTDSIKISPVKSFGITTFINYTVVEFW